jgi:hypothetical protein
LHKTTTTNPFIPSWGRLEMKPHEKKNRCKTRAKNKKKTKDDKKTKLKKKIKDNKTPSKKSEKGAGKKT